jgi:hypothetical protein
MSLSLHRRRKRNAGKEDGYILLTLLLIIALIIIAAAIIVPSITFDIKRDREEEMIHRGTQYSRAIRMYFKKFGRYPTKIEDLENSNNLRFLRKRYKDPLNCKPQCQDFKLLHYGDVQMAGSLGMGGGNIPGATAIGANGMNGGMNPGMNGGMNGGFNGPSTFGQSSFGGGNSFGGNSGFGANSNSAFGQNSQNANQPSGTDQPPDGTQNGGDQANNGNNNGTNNSGTNNGDKLSNTTFGGGPIIGVASVNKDKTIREFNHKHKYSEWLFVYDPAFDQGRLITTPYQPTLAGFGQQGVPNLNNQINGTNGANPTNNGFGTGQPPAGMQNNPNLPASGGFNNSNRFDSSQSDSSQ